MEETCHEKKTSSESSSSCYDEKSLKSSLDSSQVDSMLEYLSNKAEVRVKNQQRGDPDLTIAEKVGLLRQQFEHDPLVFQVKFEKHLLRSHLRCFTSIKTSDSTTKSLLERNSKVLEKSIMSANQKTILKNRRYEALHRMVNDGTYFNEEVMQRRNPILYEQLIGKYQSKEEREAFLKLSEESAAAATTTPLTDMFMAHMARSEDEGFSDRRTAQEQQISDEAEADEEYWDPDETMEMEDAGGAQGGDDHVEEIDDAEKELLKEEFFTTMYRSFLEGRDQDFDYATVDENEAYDCFEVLNQDEEDKYFDAEDSDSSNNSNEHVIQETNCKISAEKDDESEDELDVYMQNLEKELKASESKT